jgi:hypothetical protein
LKTNDFVIGNARVVLHFCCVFQILQAAPNAQGAQSRYARQRHLGNKLELDYLPRVTRLRSSLAEMGQEP